MSDQENDVDPREEVALAAKVARERDAAGEARQWLLEVKDATLCSLSAKAGLEGYPFGSVVPFALTAEGRPIIYIAGIAAHTANLRHDPRATLFVRQPGLDNDPQTGWRLSLMGRMKRMVRVGDKTREGESVIAVSPDDYEELHARYLERVRGANVYRDTHDFSYWQMEHVDKVRYIAGFGRICWLEGDEILRDPTGGDLDAAAPGAIAHMNEDHRANMGEMCQGLYGVNPDDVVMHAIDRAGFTLHAPSLDRYFYFSFGREIDASELRVAIIEVLKRAREKRAA